MKRWLAALAVFAACACHVDIAAADTRPPTLWQRIVSVFAPRTAIRHTAGHPSDNTQNADKGQKAAAAAKPTEAPPAGSPPQPAHQPEQVAALTPAPDPAPSGAPVETASRV